MYPTRLNVMSPEKQRHIKRMMFMGFIENSFAIVFVVLAVFGIFTLIAQMFLQSYFADVALQSIRTHNPAREINERVVDINDILMRADAIQSTYISWRPHAAAVSGVIPEDIQLSSLAFNPDAGTLQLVGSAPSRESLLALKSALETLPAIDTVSVPISNLTQAADIKFSFAIPYRF